MTLWFENNNGEWRPIAECAKEIDAITAIHQFIDKCNENKPEDEKFISYYTRILESDDLILMLKFPRYLWRNNEYVSSFSST